MKSQATDNNGQLFRKLLHEQTLVNSAVSQQYNEEFASKLNNKNPQNNQVNQLKHLIREYSPKVVKPDVLLMKKSKMSTQRCGVINHRNPLNQRVLYPILRQTYRPISQQKQSQNSQYDSIRNFKCRQSQPKTPLCDQTSNKTPLKTKYISSEQKNTNLPNPQTSTFLQVCWQKVSNQNIHLTKQFMSKQVQLRRLINQLHQIKTKNKEQQRSTEHNTHQHKSNNQQKRTLSQKYPSLKNQDKVMQNHEDYGELQEYSFTDQNHEHDNEINIEGGHHYNEIQALIHQIEEEQLKLESQNGISEARDLYDDFEYSRHTINKKL